MKKLLVLLFVLVSCASMTWSPEEKAFMNEVLAQPLTFNVTKDKDKEAWARAQGFIAKYTSMKIQQSTEFLIETYNPVKSSKYSPGFNYAYKVSKMPVDTLIEYTVSCVSDNPFDDGAINNAHLLAWFIVNGTIKYPKLIKGRNHNF